ncbi:MAG: hypothetical protein HY898_23325 [Deltaproteobacteria bacterium]|nr:hypothetical protein [Deltaproteobacteria bacterium]
MNHRPLLLYVLASALIACSSGADSSQSPAPADAASEPSEDAPDGSAAEAEAASEAEAQAPVDANNEAPEPAVNVERWGARIWGPILGIRRTARSLWIGTTGLPDPYAPDPKPIRGGLVRLEIDTGQVQVFDKSLPEWTYGDPSDPLGSGPMPTASVLQDGTRHLVVARGGVLEENQGSFTLHKLETSPGVNASPVAMALDRDGGRSRLWLSTDRGLLLVDPADFKVTKTLGQVELGTEQVGSLAIDPATGAVFVAAYQTTVPSEVIRVGDSTIDHLIPGSAGVTSGLVGDVVWSTDANAALIALASWQPAQGGVVAWNGVSSAQTWMNEGALSQAATGQAGAFGTSHLAMSQEDGLLVVGGSLQAGTLAGGGIAWVRLTDKAVVGMSSATHELPGDHVSALEYDPITHRTYAALRYPCNDLKLGNLGLVAISVRNDGTARFERPILSGVRAIAKVDDRVLLGLRDDNPGLSCDGYPIQTGLVELKGNRSGEMIPLKVTKGSEAILPYAGATALGARAPSRFAVGTYRDGLFLGTPSDGEPFNQAISWGVSLYLDDVAWSGDDQVWIAGRSGHMTGDPDVVADKGPRGAALLSLTPEGKVSSFLHYVRVQADPTEVEGLPSSEVRAVIMDADGGAWIVSATERVTATGLDREQREVFTLNGESRLGGITRVAKDGTLQVIASGKDVPDPRAAAFDASGDLMVLDAEQGLLRVKATGEVQTAALPGALPAGAPQGLWWGGAGDLAALTSAGVLLSLSGETRVLDDVGWGWRAAERSKGFVLIGTDQGLVRARGKGVDDIPEAPPGQGQLPSFP